MSVQRCRWRTPPHAYIDHVEAARALGGEANGKSLRVPGPGHSRVDRSLSVLFDTAAPDGFIVYSHAGDDIWACREYVKAALKLTFSRCEGSENRTRRLIIRDLEERSAAAMRIWSESTDRLPLAPIRYLRKRGVLDALPPTAIGEALRWYQDGYLVALVRDVVTDEPTAIHRTYLDREGRKLDRKCLGPVGRGAVKLTDSPDVTRSLAIGEGIETTLSLRRLPDLENLAVWAVLSSGQLAAFPVLGGIESLWVAVDHDAPGITAANRVRDTWMSAGKEVVTVTPKKVGADLNDIGGLGHEG